MKDRYTVKHVAVGHYEVWDTHENNAIVHSDCCNLGAIAVCNASNKAYMVGLDIGTELGYARALVHMQQCIVRAVREPKEVV